MIKKLIFIYFLLNILNPLFGQINRNGIPFIRNFTTHEYKAAEQNWAVCMDKRGVVYFGNNQDGVLEFDGSSWNTIPILNNSIVRSLAADDNGNIYVGAVGDFGYLAPDIKGKMHYNSLYKEEFDSLDIGDVFYIFSDGFQDQFGGEDGSKFKTKNFKRLLLEIHQKPMSEQRKILNSTIDEWRGKWEQVDDIIIMGVRVK